MWRRSHQRHERNWWSQKQISEASRSRKVDFPVVEAPVSWVNISSSSQSLPSNAYAACVLETGEEAFVTKANIHGDTVTGLTTRNGMQACIPYNSAEHMFDDFDVMVTEDPNTLCWVPDSNGNFPKHAVKGGRDSSETNYIGRTCTPLNEGRTYLRDPINLNRNVKKGSRLGKIHPSHRCLYIPHNGGEYIYNRYEVLCHKTSPATLAAICKWKVNTRLVEVGRDMSDVSFLPLPKSLLKFLSNE